MKCEIDLRNGTLDETHSRDTSGADPGGGGVDWAGADPEK